MGKTTVYDAGTGVIPEYRGRGIAKNLFSFIFPRLRENGVEQYLLEVIDSNEPALNLYRQLGFQTQRKLAVLSSNAPLEGRRGAVPDEALIVGIDTPDWELFRSFWDWSPSWQNSVAAIERSISRKVILGACIGGACVGYGIVYVSSGSIAQLAVAKDQRRKGIGTLLLHHLRRAVDSGKPLRVINVDTSSEATMTFYAVSGFSTLVRQDEMIKGL